MDTHGRSFAVSNADRVVFPDVAATKGDVVSHYDRLAELILPHVRMRPLSLLRVHGDLHGDRFMQKQAGRHHPDWVARVVTPKREGGEITMAAADEPAVLPWLAQQGAVELHPWLSRADALDHPRDLVLDLDPWDDPTDDTVVLGAVRSATRTVLAVLDELGYECDLKTSGSRGYHVLVRLDGRHDADRVKAAAHAVAREVVARDPDGCTVEHRIDKRGARVFVDWLRNGYAQTVVAPYSLRLRPTAPVATPIDRDELSRATPRSWNIHNIHRRLGQRDCPWRGREQRQGQSLDAALALTDDRDH